jgi:hypothetical protein
MQGHHRTREGLRPRHLAEAAQPGGDGHDHADGMPARLFLCQGCRVQVLICSHCDRGHIYFIAPKAAPGKRADARNAKPVAVIRAAVTAAPIMRREHAATGRAKIT